MSYDPRILISLCIPRCIVSCEYLADVFSRLNLGEICRIDMVTNAPRVGNKASSKAFVHYSCWHDTEASQRTYERLLRGESVKVVYDKYLFWRVFLSRSNQNHKTKYIEAMNLKRPSLL